MTIFVVVVAALVIILFCLGCVFSVMFDVLMVLQGIFSAILWMIGRTVTFIEAVIKVIKGRERE